MSTTVTTDAVATATASSRRPSRRRPHRDPQAVALLKAFLASPGGEESTAARAALLAFQTREEYLGVRTELRLAIGDQERRTRAYRRAIGQAVRLARFLRRSKDAASLQGNQPLAADLGALVARMAYSKESRALHGQGSRLQELALETRKRAAQLRTERLAAQAA